MTSETDKAAAKARAESIRSEIASLSKRASKKAAGAGTKTGPDGRESPRDFIHRRMSELD